MTSGKSSREQRAAKVAAQRAAARKAEARRRNGIIGGAVIAVLAVAVLVTALVMANNNKVDSTAATPANVGGTGGTSFFVGQDTAKVTVTVFEDFQCPICKSFEASVGPTMAQLQQAGTIRIEYRPIAFLDRMSSTNYSTRALNAAACVINSTPDKFSAFHTSLYENQPAENTAGLTDSSLIKLAEDAGAKDVSSCITKQTYKGWTVRVTDAASKDGVNGTPTVMVNGKALVNPSADQLTQAVQAAAQG